MANPPLWQRLRWPSSVQLTYIYMDKITAVFSVNYYHVPYVPEIIIDGFFRGKL